MMANAAMTPAMKTPLMMLELASPEDGATEPQTFWVQPGTLSGGRIGPENTLCQVTQHTTSSMKRDTRLPFQGVTHKGPGCLEVPPDRRP